MKDIIDFYVKETKRLNKLHDIVNESDNVGKTILNQIKSINKWALPSYGAKNIMTIEKGIQFDVKGSKFKGRVLITLQPDDTYMMEFGNVRKLEWKLKKTLKGIFAEDLVNTLDQHIG